MKSGPELWAEVSDPASLGGHLAAFGPIRITRTADASLVEWEGEKAAGRLELAPAGFGTRVVLEAEAATVAPAPTPAAQVAPEPAPAPPPAPPAPRPGFWARLGLRRAAPSPPAPPAPPAPPPPPAGPPARVPVIADDEVLGVLEATLEALGSAHRRPFTNS